MRQPLWPGRLFNKRGLFGYSSFLPQPLSRWTKKVEYHVLSLRFVCIVVAADVDCVWLCPRTELVEYFRAQMDKDPGMASAVAAIRTLLEFLKRDKGVLLSSNLMCSWKQESVLTSFLCPIRRNYPGSEREPDVGDSPPDRGGLLRGCVLRRRALPALHQPHITGAWG